MAERGIDGHSEKNAPLDLTRLVGFSAVGDTKVDFRDRTFAARIGAKTGVPEPEDNGGAPARD